MAITERRHSREVAVGDVTLGGRHPVAVQSMTNSPSHDVDATVRQLWELKELGCQIARVAVPDRPSVAIYAEIIKRSPMPVVADIHFNAALALACLEAGAPKIRLNPGNIRDNDLLRQIAKSAIQRQAAIRIGVNSGSIDTRQHLSHADNKDGAFSSESRSHRMAQATLSWLAKFVDYGCTNLVLSLKASDITETLSAVRIVAEACDFPIHLGLTAAGLENDAILRSALALGPLLLAGIGDTLRISITGAPQREILAARRILSECGLPVNPPAESRLISCPTCGRTHGNLLQLAELVQKELPSFPPGLTVAVMGCEVNGPGEAQDADLGISLTPKPDEALLFVRGLSPRRIVRSQVIAELRQAAENLHNLALTQ